MKTKLLLLPLFFFTFIFQSSKAQCTENVTNFGNNISIPSYNISGDVDVTLNVSDNTVTLDLGTNFTTAEGPDVRAYLVKSNGASDATLRNTQISNLENIALGLVGALPGFGNPTTPINGAKSLTVSIPNGENIEDYDKVFFYCLMFNQFWDLGTYSSFSISACSALSIEENSLENLSIYPNPSSETINIKSSNNSSIDINAEISIFNTLGKLVYKKEQELNTSIDISEMNPGLYIVKIVSDGKETNKRIIIE